MLRTSMYGAPALATLALHHPLSHVRCARLADHILASSGSIVEPSEAAAKLKELQVRLAFFNNDA
jgi:hypothetical protein